VERKGGKREKLLERKKNDVIGAKWEIVVIAELVRYLESTELVWEGGKKG